MEEQTQETESTPVAASTAKHVVVFGKHDYILQNVEGLLKKEGYRSTGFVDLEEASDQIRMNPLDGLLIVGGVDPHDRQALTDMVRRDFPHVRIVEHFGGPATILPEVKSAFEK